MVYSQGIVLDSFFSFSCFSGTLFHVYDDADKTGHGSFREDRGFWGWFFFCSLLFSHVDSIWIRTLGWLGREY